MAKKKPLDSPVRPDLVWLQAIKNNKYLVILSVVEFAVIVVLVIALVSVFPLKEKELVILEFQSGGNNFVVLEKASGRISENMALVSRFMRMYVVNRETVDKITEPVRYPNVIAYSSPKVRTSFKQLYGDKEKGLYFKKGFKRTIIIKRDAPLSPRIYQVEFTTLDSYDWETKETKNEWVATLKFQYVDQKVSYDERYLNPMGMFVTEYTLSRRK